MRNAPARIALALLLTGIIALPATAYVYPLDSTEIRDAYFIAQRNDEQTAEFFLPYSHSLPMPNKGPHVAVISVATPFSQIVEQGGRAGYHPQDLEEQFLGKPMEILVRVQIEFTPSYPAPSATGKTLSVQPLPDLWNDLKIQLRQGEAIPSKARHTYLVYSDAAPNVFGLAGVILEEAYDPGKIASEPATVVVDTRDGQHVETTFNLAALR